jgi:hypothetical protein
MGRKYYYLVSGLPNLVDSVKNFDYLKIREQIVELLAKDDAELLKLLLLQFDNENVINFLDKKSDFDTRAWMSKAEMEEALSDPILLPKYMQTFLQDRKDGKDSVAGLGSFEQLSYLYYTEIAEKNKWFADWANFCVDVQNVVAALNARELGLPVEKSVIPFNDNAEKIAKSRAADFGLSGVLPWLEQITGNVHPIATELAIDDIYHNKIDELSMNKEFEIESVLGFMVRAYIVDRWMRLDTKDGMARAQKLLEDLKASLPK